MNAAPFAERELRQPPHNFEAEQAVLGAILLSNEALAKAREVIGPDEFYRPAHRRIFEAMTELSKQNQVIDLVTLTDYLQHTGTLEGIGGSAYLTDLTQSVATAASVTHHAKIIGRYSWFRKIEEKAHRLLLIAEAGRDDAEAYVEKELKALLASGRQRTSSSSPDLTEVAIEYHDLLRLEIIKSGRHLPWLPERSIIMVHGPRGDGKTWYALSLTTALVTGSSFLKWSVTAPVGVLYVDGEMALDELRQRATSLMTTTPQAPLWFLTGEVVFNKLECDLVLSSESMRDATMRILDAHPEIRVVILDNVSCLFAGIDEDKKRDWEQINAWLIRLRHRGLAVVLIHHSGKGGQQRGTSGREDSLDTVVRLDRPADHDASDGCHFELRFTKCRSVKGEDVTPLDVQLGDKGGILQWTFKTLEESKIHKATRLFEEGVTSPTDLAEELGITKGYASKMLRKIRAQQVAE